MGYGWLWGMDGYGVWMVMGYGWLRGYERLRGMDDLGRDC